VSGTRLGRLQQGLEHFRRAGGRQRVEPQLRVIGLAAQPCWYSGR